MYPFQVPSAIVVKFHFTTIAVKWNFTAIAEGSREGHVLLISS
jgi:hypothetical protein